MFELTDTFKEKLANSYLDLISITENGKKPETIKRIRDLSLIKIIEGISLVIACDSNASNGMKEYDTHISPYTEVGINALKVPLMEVLASGAVPFVIINNLCVEMEPTGKKIIQVMKDELEKSGLWESIQFTGSTEDNMVTKQTGIGVTVIGLLSENKSRLCKSQLGDVVYCIGIPQSGIDEPYSEQDHDVAKINTVIKLNSLDYIHEILPVGSKGVRYEANELAEYSGYQFQEKIGLEIDVETSAGSSTAVLISLNKKDEARILKDMIEIPVFPIGLLI